MSYFIIGGPSKKPGTNKLPPTRRTRVRSEGQRRLQSIYFTILPPEDPSLWIPSWLSEPHATSKGPEEVTGQRQFRNSSHPHRNPRLWAMWQSSPPGFPDLPAHHPGAPSQWSFLLCQLGQFISECYIKAQPQALEGVPFLQQHFKEYKIRSPSLTLFKYIKYKTQLVSRYDVSQQGDTIHVVVSLCQSGRPSQAPESARSTCGSLHMADLIGRKLDWPRASLFSCESIIKQHNEGVLEYKRRNWLE